MKKADYVNSNPCLLSNHREKIHNIKMKTRRKSKHKSRSRVLVIHISGSLERLQEGKTLDIYKVQRPQSTRSMSKLPQNVSQKKLFGLHISIPTKEKSQKNPTKTTEKKPQRLSVPRSNNKYGKYLNTNRNHQRRLSKGNKLYVKRILKQNKEYRQLQMKRFSNSVEKAPNLRESRNEEDPLLQLQINKNRKDSKQLSALMDKKQTKTYKKYLNVVSNTCDFRTFLKKDQPITRRRRNRGSTDLPVKNNIIISPKNYQPQDLKELHYFSSTRGTSNGLRENMDPSHNRGTCSSIKTSQHSKTESRYSKQMETKMAEHIIDSSFMKKLINQIVASE
ncbi:unnamed protein product [Moneuplotes crassus]|uniref:Uncharacterized protein n=1 Tax=Euplotes crassus TaxID=5936 RepID=A0AAD1XH23_EUPCR|nr:unnamed protein product [Moneuplotes crassus]